MTRLLLGPKVALSGNCGHSERTRPRERSPSSSYGIDAFQRTRPSERDAVRAGAFDSTDGRLRRRRRAGTKGIHDEIVHEQLAACGGGAIRMAVIGNIGL